MTTITIELEDELAERLAETALSRRTTVQKLATRSLERIITEPETEFERHARAILEDNAELYRRLEKPDEDFNRLVQRIIEEDRELLIRLA